MRLTSFLRRSIASSVLMVGILSGVAAQSTVVPPTGTPVGFMGTAAPVGTPQPLQTDPNVLLRQVRLNPDLLRVVAATSDGVSTSALIAPVAEDVDVFVRTQSIRTSLSRLTRLAPYAVDEWAGQGLPAPFTPFRTRRPRLER